MTTRNEAIILALNLLLENCVKSHPHSSNALRAKELIWLLNRDDRSTGQAPGLVPVAGKLPPEKFDPNYIPVPGTYDVEPASDDVHEPLK
jgi:hypothetical protein